MVEMVHYLLGQWLNFKLFGITYLVEKIKFKPFFFQGPGRLSEIISYKYPRNTFRIPRMRLESSKISCSSENDWINVNDFSP